MARTLWRVAEFARARLRIGGLRRGLCADGAVFMVARSRGHTADRARHGNRCLPGSRSRAYHAVRGTAVQPYRRGSDELDCGQCLRLIRAHPPHAPAPSPRTHRCDLFRLQVLSPTACGAAPTHIRARMDACAGSRNPDACAGHTAAVHRTFTASLPAACRVGAGATPGFVRGAGLDIRAGSPAVFAGICPAARGAQFL